MIFVVLWFKTFLCKRKLEISLPMKEQLLSLYYFEFLELQMFGGRGDREHIDSGLQLAQFSVSSHPSRVVKRSNSSHDTTLANAMYTSRKILLCRRSV